MSGGMEKSDPNSHEMAFIHPKITSRAIMHATAMIMHGSRDLKTLLK